MMVVEEHDDLDLESRASCHMRFPHFHRADVLAGQGESKEEFTSTQLHYLTLHELDSFDSSASAWAPSHPLSYLQIISASDQCSTKPRSVCGRVQPHLFLAIQVQAPSATPIVCSNPRSDHPKLLANQATPWQYWLAMVTDTASR